MQQLMTDIFSNRRYALQYIFIAVIIIFIARLFYIQVIETDYQQLAKSNVLREVTVFPARGLVHDRKGKLIIDNQKEYDLWVIPNQVKNFDTLGFCDLVGVSDTFFRDVLGKANKYSRVKPTLLIKGISVDKFASIQEELYLFPGVYGQVRTVRAYPYKVAAHVLGYISEVNQKMIEKSEGYYKSGDYIGTGGIEQSYENELRGIKGIRFVLVDNHNRDMGSFNDGKFDTAAIPGNNMISTLDIELQKYGEELMKGKIGSIVAIEPKTGEILCMISTPTYDPDLLTGQDRSRNFAKLLNDSMKPLFVRPLKAPYPPGSTYKPTLALIGLQLGAIDFNTTYNCPGAYYVGSLRVGCHHRGFVPNVSVAIQHSCNSYFCQTQRKIMDDKSFKNVAEGLDYWKQMLSEFGIGVKTGIDLPNEGYGFIPSSDYYNRIYGKGSWNSVTVVSLGIGQGEIGETPLQMANTLAAIANYGYWITPHVVRQIESGNDSILKKNIIRHMIPIDSQYFRMVNEGLKDVVEAGTGRVAQIPGVTLAGKTGTSQNPHGEDHSNFICYAPYENPRIAIVVVVENGGYGAQYAAPIASLMIEKYLNDTISTSRKYLEERMLNSKIKYK